MSVQPGGQTPEGWVDYDALAADAAETFEPGEDLAGGKDGFFIYFHLRHHRPSQDGRAQPRVPLGHYVTGVFETTCGPATST